MPATSKIGTFTGRACRRGAMTAFITRREYQWNYRSWVLETSSWVCAPRLSMAPRCCRYWCLRYPTPLFWPVWSSAFAISGKAGHSSSPPVSSPANRASLSFSARCSRGVWRCSGPPSCCCWGPPVPCRRFAPCCSPIWPSGSVKVSPSCPGWIWWATPSPRRVEVASSPPCIPSAACWASAPRCWCAWCCMRTGCIFRSGTVCYSCSHFAASRFPHSRSCSCVSRPLDRTKNTIRRSR